MSGEQILATFGIPPCVVGRNPVRFRSPWRDLIPAWPRAEERFVVEHYARMAEYDESPEGRRDASVRWARSWLAGAVSEQRGSNVNRIKKFWIESRKACVAGFGALSVAVAAGTINGNNKWVVALLLVGSTFFGTHGVTNRKVGA